MEKMFNAILGTLAEFESDLIRDKGGERATAIYSLIEIARLNGIDPEAWLRDVLSRVGNGHPVNRIAELMPWALSPSPSPPLSPTRSGRAPGRSWSVGDGQRSTEAAFKSGVDVSASRQDH